MSKVKGRYAATVILDIEYDESQDTRPFDEVKSDLRGGTVTNVIRDAITSAVDERSMTIKVEQQYADLYRVDEDLYKI